MRNKILVAIIVIILGFMLVIFARGGDSEFVKELKQYNPVVVEAGMKPQDMNRIIKEFQADPTKKIIIASINIMNTSNKTEFLTNFYEINKDKDDFNELFKALLCKIGHPNYKINKNKRIPRFLGVYECGKLPNAEPGDIIQIRIPIDGETIDGYNNHICD